MFSVAPRPQFIGDAPTVALAAQRRQLLSQYDRLAQEGPAQLGSFWKAVALMIEQAHALGTLEGSALLREALRDLVAKPEGQ